MAVGGHNFVESFDFPPIGNQFSIDPVGNIGLDYHFRWWRMYLGVHVLDYVRSLDDPEGNGQVVDLSPGVVAPPPVDGHAGEVLLTPARFPGREVVNVLVDCREATWRVEWEDTIETRPVFVDVISYDCACLVEDI